MKASRKSVIGLISLAIVVWIVIIVAVVDDSDTKGNRNIENPPLPGNAGVYHDIATESDCGDLQATFDRAMDNYDLGINKEIVMSYAEAAISRMEAICYKP